MSGTLALRVHGGLAGAVCGDAFGTATETMARVDVVSAFGWLDAMIAPAGSPYSSGRPVGSFTDDSSQLLLLTELMTQRPNFGVGDVAAMLLRWAEDAELAGRFTGPTTGAALARLRAGEDPLVVGRGHPGHGVGATNGAAMKAAPAGWSAPGDHALAAERAHLIAAPSHNNSLAVAGAAAVACAAAAAADGAAVADVVTAAIEGAERGERLGAARGVRIAGPSIASRIRWACSLVEPTTAPDVVADTVADLVGAGLAAAEAVPAALAFVWAGGGDVRRTITCAVNAGDDADTVAAIAGAIAGTVAGIDGVPAEWVECVSDVNGLDLATTAGRFVAVYGRDRSSS